MTERTRLVRAVAPSELADILQTGRFRISDGALIEYFSLTAEGARRYGRMAEATFNDGPYRIVSTTIVSTLIKEWFRVTVDGGIASAAIPIELLRRLEIPQLEDP